jgi:hypothetical protein
MVLEAHGVTDETTVLLCPWTDVERASLRSKAVHAYGKITASGVEHLCRVRDISARGIRIEARVLPQPGQRVLVEMRGLESCPAVLVWRAGNVGGFAFETAQEIMPIFDDRPSRALRQPRMPRFALNVPARLHCADGVAELETVDVSLGGLKLRGISDFDVGDYGIVTLDALPDALPGHIRWIRGGLHGFCFDRPMLSSDLHTVLAFCD